MACNTLRAGPEMASAGEIRGPTGSEVTLVAAKQLSQIVFSSFFPGAKLPGPEHKAFLA